jgi:probable rRNA maturation factor
VSSTVKRLPAAETAIRRAAVAALESERANSALLSIAFVGARAISELNRKYLRKRSATDVISFALKNPVGSSAVVGDIYICPDVARANAKRQRVSVREEILRLVVHGVLHVLGNDHPEGPRRGASAMWRRQEAIVAALA